MSTERWTGKTREVVPEADTFLAEIDEVCKKHNISISHEDCYGSFILTNYDQETADWLFAAAWQK